MRKLFDDGVLTDSAGQLAGALYGYGGAALLGRQIELLSSGRTWVWSGLNLLRRIPHHASPFRHEEDLVNRIAFRELNFAGVPDGLPLDPSVGIAEHNPRARGVREGALRSDCEMPRFGWPTVVISGGRDLVTRPRWPAGSPD